MPTAHRQTAFAAESPPRARGSARSNRDLRSSRAPRSTVLRWACFPRFNFTTEGTETTEKENQILSVTSAISAVNYIAMRLRTYKNTDLTVSEVGFGLWTISTGWWGNFTEGEAIALMHKAFDLGITLFDAADTYGNGLSEELIAKAFPAQRDQIVIATKVGYDFVHHGEARGRGQREIPQDFSPEAIERATDAALKRLKTDRIDLLQLHNIRMEQIYDDALWKTVEKLKASGKIRYYGIALGPAIGWLYEGVNCIRERDRS